MFVFHQNNAASYQPRHGVCDNNLFINQRGVRSRPHTNRDSEFRSSSDGEMEIGFEICKLSIVYAIFYCC